MSFGRRPHATASSVTLAICIVAAAVSGRTLWAQPVRPAAPAKPAVPAKPAPVPAGKRAAPAAQKPARPTPSPADLAATTAPPPPTPAPAGAAKPPSVPEPGDIPPWRDEPLRFAVAPFVNRANIKPFEWLVAGAPFEISQKTEAVLGLEPTGGTLHVEGVAVAAEPDAVAAFAARRRATFVITGWFERPNWQLRIELTLWKIVAGRAAIAAQAQRTGDVKTYHQLLGDALGEIWATGENITVDAARSQRLQRALASDLYAVNLLGRGLGYLTGALAINIKAAEHDLERAVFIDPKCFEAQRLIGEVWLALAAGDPKLTNRAVAKFNYANDLAPEDIGTLRAAALGAAQVGKHETAVELFRKLVVRRPWDLDARYRLGAAMWRTGDTAGAEKQLEQVTARRPDDLGARRVLVMIHAARSDTAKLVHELELIAARAPLDLEIKADLASAYSELGQWDQALVALEAVAAARPADIALAMRIGDTHRKKRDLEGALAAYARAGKLAPESSWPGFAAAQTLFDAGKLPEAWRAYIALLRYREDLPYAEHALGSIALVQGRFDEAAWYLRKAAREAPRNLPTWRAVIAAELGRRDAITALREVTAGLPTWPNDAALHYLAGVANAMLDERDDARRHFAQATSAAAAPEAMRSGAATAAAAAAAEVAQSALAAGTTVTLQFTPELVRPWGDADAVMQMLDRYQSVSEAMSRSRTAYQGHVLTVLGALHRGPLSPARRDQVRRCPIARVAAGWSAAQRELAAGVRLGVELESTWRFIARHEDAGATAALLPNVRTQVTAARKAWRIALADLTELRSEWARGLMPELRAAGCTDRMLVAGVADPARYRALDEDQPEVIPTLQPTRPRARATFYVDNTRCLDPVEVWIDGAHIGQVAPGRRSALVADGGERTLCLLVPGAAQCGDRSTVRQVYLHDGWSTQMHCLK